MSNERVFIGLGANLGESATTLLRAWEEIAALDAVAAVQLSSPYVTAPVAMSSTNLFCNAVAEVRTTLPPELLLENLLTIEARLGRVRDARASGYQDRHIDLDIIYYGQQVINTIELVLPHPQRCLRLFVLTPLAEIAPEFVDVQRAESVAHLEQQLRAAIDQGREEAQSIDKISWQKT
ncbi:MAG: 2-amino-4-hydroxy-6-hydroxymethyldihydropteridine diphosphokinase [Desulfobacterales bacterium]|nr:MAG: 2-amino-4-hydroxy-6-hydroxymethyldihydropteridine diphosphokinase [Desulfobacterales bacterium]